MFSKTKQTHNIISLVGLISIINAIYLTNLAYGDSGGICHINEVLSCQSVFGFSRSWVIGVPFPVLAMIVYPIIMFLAQKGRSYNKQSQKRWKATAIVSTCGILFNSYFLVHEIIDNVYCPLCLLCLAAIITISILSRREYIRVSKK